MKAYITFAPVKRLSKRRAEELDPAGRNVSPF